MLNALIDGMIAALRTAFGDEIPIYTDTVEQGLTEPCFSVRIVKPNVEQFLGDRYFRSNLVAVHYFPQNYGDNEEMNHIMETLFSALELIEVDGALTRGTKPDVHVEDGVGIYTIHYDFFTYKVGENAPERMDGVEWKGVIL